MFFWLKKLIQYWLMPLSFTGGAILIGIWQMSRPKWARAGRRLMIVSVVVLLLFSNPWVGTALLRPIETQYPPIPELTPGTPLPAGLADCRYVVVLGSGNGHTPGYAANNLLWSPGVARIMEGVRLLRALPSAKLILTGPGTPENESHARVLGRAAQSLGVDPDRMLYVEDVRDTRTNRARWPGWSGALRSRSSRPPGTCAGASLCFAARGWRLPPARPST